MKKTMLVLCLLCLFACGNERGTASSGSESGLASNTAWPYEVVGEVDIVDAGFGDSDYANWAVGSVVVNGEYISIDFETSVLEAAGIDSEFNFSNPATLNLGAPKKEYGELTYPVVEIK